MKDLEETKRISFLSHESFDQSSSRLEDSNQKGDHGERIAASLLVQALGAEVRWGSRNEDSNKWDLLVSYDPPHFHEKIMCTFQVKTGPSFAKYCDDTKILKITKSTLNQCYRSITRNILCWVDLEKSRAFVHAVFSKPSKPAEIKFPLEIDPSLPYFLTPIILFNQRKGTKTGITISNNNQNLTPELRNSARHQFRCYEYVFNPVFGRIALTNHSWNHMFRDGRKEKRQLNSLIVIPYLNALLEKCPSSLYTNSSESFKVSKEYVVRQREYTLIYNGIQLQGKGTSTIVIRVLKEVRFNRYWRIDFKKSLDTLETTVLRSIYIK
ncbi:MAG: hypothetical protein ACK5W1_08560 [Flavobacteriales bacterium]